MKNLSIVLVALGCLILYASFLTPRIKIGGDAVEYVRLANALAHGEGYRVDGHFNSKWPPVTPLLHSVVIRVAGVNVTGFKFASMLAALIALWLSYLLLKRHYDDRLARYAALLATVSFPVIYWVVDVSSEAPYFLFSITGVLLAEEALKRQRWLWAIGAGLAFGLAVLSRTVGLALIIGLSLSLLAHWIRGRRSEATKLLLAVSVAVVLVGAWFAYSRIQSGKTSVSTYGSYAFRGDVFNPETKSDTTTFLWRAKENAVGYTFIFAVPDASIRSKQAARLTPLGLVSATIILLSLAGWLWRLWKHPRIGEWCLLVYGGTLLVVNWYDIRYLVPIMPLLLFYFAFAVDGILRWVAEKLSRPAWAPIATATVLGVMIAGNAALSAVGPQAKRLRAPEYSGAAKEIHDAARWIKQNRPDAVVLSRQANMVWFWTQLKTTGIPLIGDPAAMWQHIREKQVTVIISEPDEFSGVTGKYLLPALQAHPDELQAIATFGRTVVYDVKR